MNVTENITLISPSPLFHPKSDFPKREVHPSPNLRFTQNLTFFSPRTYFNPYRQISETISKKRAVTQGISRKLFPDFAILGRDSGDFPETISR